MLYVVCVLQRNFDMSLDTQLQLSSVLELVASYIPYLSGLLVDPTCVPWDMNKNEDDWPLVEVALKTIAWKFFDIGCRPASVRFLTSHSLPGVK